MIFRKNSSLLLPISLEVSLPPPAFKKGGVLETMCIHLKVYETAFVSFCAFLLQHFDFFWYGFLQICKLWRNQNTRQEICSALSPRITNPRKLFKSDKTKGLPSFWEVKIFEWFKNILRTIWTYKIWMKFLLGNKLNDLCHETLYFLVFKYFLFSFVSILMQVLKYFFNWGSSFWLTLLLYFGYVLWNSYQLLLILLIGDQCLTWRFHFDYFLILC